MWERGSEQTPELLSAEEIEAIADQLRGGGYVAAQDAEGLVYLVPPEQALPVLQTHGLDPRVRDALLEQLDEWLKLAKFAKWLSVGLAAGSGVLLLFTLSAMTWDDLFADSGLWELSIVLFALAVFIASPLAIFVVGRPLKGVDEWSPTVSASSAK